MNWCSEHPRYEAKRRPTSPCQQCLKLWLLRSPEDKVNVETMTELAPQEPSLDYYDGYKP